MADGNISHFLNMERLNFPAMLDAIDKIPSTSFSKLSDVSSEYDHVGSPFEAT